MLHNSNGGDSFSQARKIEGGRNEIPWVLSYKHLVAWGENRVAQSSQIFRIRENIETLMR